MKALVLESYSKPPVFKDVPIPKPKKNEVLVKVIYAGINRADLAVLSGRYGNSVKFPLIMGLEAVGTLSNGKKVAVNPYLHCGKCRFCKKGEFLVCAKGRPLLGIQKNGGYAQYILAPKENIIPIPDGINFIDACSVIVSGGTSYRMVNTISEIKSSDTVVVTAAASAVGVYSCQFSMLKKANVIAIIGEEFKKKKLKNLGIRQIINYSKRSWIQKLKKIIPGQGIDKLIDTVGGSKLEQLIPLVSSLGKISFCGATENPNIILNLINLYVKQITLRGTSGFTNDDLTEIFNLIKQGKIKPVFDSVYQFDEIPKAWEKLKARKVFGKIMIKISP